MNLSVLRRSVILITAVGMILMVSPRTAAADNDDYTKIISGDLTFFRYSDHTSVVKCAQDVVSVDIPETIDGVPVTAIGCGAFSFCEDLQYVTFPDSLRIIENSAFSNCTSLAAVSFPDSLQTLQDYCFFECSGLQSITFGSGVELIGYGAFWKCTSLPEVTIPDQVTSIDGETFLGCTALKKARVGSGISELPYAMFKDCIALKDVSIPDVHRIDSSVFAGCRSLTEYTIPETVTELGYSAFEKCESLKSIVIPDTVTLIGLNVFQGCTGLEQIQLGTGLTRATSGFLQGCSSLLEVELPENIKAIDFNAMPGCTNLERLIIRNPDCEIAPYENTVATRSDIWTGEYFFDGVIMGYDGSTAQTYANRNGFPFESLGPVPLKLGSGDIDVNGKVNIGDVVLLAQYLSECPQTDITPEGLENADMDGDNELDADDYSLLLEKLI